MSKSNTSLTFFMRMLFSPVALISDIETEQTEKGAAENLMQCLMVSMGTLLVALVALYFLLPTMQANPLVSVPILLVYGIYVFSSYCVGAACLKRLSEFRDV